MKRIVVLLLVGLMALPAQAQLGIRKKNAKAKQTDKMAVDTLPGLSRIVELMNMVDKNYVETPDMDHLSEEAVKAVLKSLDPHSM